MNCAVYVLQLVVRGKFASIPNLPHALSLSFVLFQDKHPPGCLVRSGFERVEIDAAGHRFSKSVSSVPIGGGFSSQVVRSILGAKIQLPHQLTLGIVDAEGNRRVGG